MTTPTPRTDAVREETRGLSGLAKAIRFADLADALERDLAAAQEEVAALKELVSSQHNAQRLLSEDLAREKDAVIRAEALAEQNKKDAERYRWLRIQPHADIAACWYMPVIPQDYPVDTPEQRDAAIDAARKP